MKENDMSETNSTNSHINNNASENDRSETVVSEDMGKQNNKDGVVIDREDMIDENEVVFKHTENETKSDHLGNTNKYDLSFALRKGTRSYAKCHNRNFSTRLCGTCLARSTSQPFEIQNSRINSQYDVASLLVLEKMFL
ncbi:uncharacterized protein E5676_scaffold142G00210 [Cucumis melo var. makuwa]|uniref:Uncharacterized protein n=1 Tax=Cucumis melo var. makuwa TaxID=1194695 RepID=A0A5D3DHJ9_CUCMM|nr:uncharacterized protein E5676_scaffold142G00210 [Cucumis melo var. makuwa]